MKHYSNRLFVINAALIVATCMVGRAAENTDAQNVLETSGVTGGLIVHVGCGDGHLTAALGAPQGFVVQGLDTDAGNVAKASERIRVENRYGKVTVSVYDGSHLPYTDNLVNVLVVSDAGELSKDEMLRVLAPRGVACVKEGQGWSKTVKPWPQDIDQWTHYLHGPDNNAVAQDRRAGAPRHLQWLADPFWSRNHHKLASISSVVSSNGRLFYIVDKATGADMRIPGKWSLVARDAFNGVLFWKRSFPRWVSQLNRFRSGPVQLGRTLVAVGDQVYLPLGANEPVSEVDATTGLTLRTFECTKGAEELIVRGDILYVVKGDPAAEYSLFEPSGEKGELKKNVELPRKSILAVERTSGKILWKWSSPKNAEPIPLTLAVNDTHAVFAEAERVVCLEARTGRECWSTETPYTLAQPGKPLLYKAELSRVPRYMSPAGSSQTARSLGWSVGTLVLQKEAVLWAGTHELRVLDVADGKILWSVPCRPGYCRSPVDLFVIGDEVWLGPDFVAARDLKTGKVTRENEVFENLWTAGHHHRCYRNKATSRFILTASRGVELMDLEGDNHSRNNWVRGVCQYGILPCNGLLYAPPHACGCYIEAMMRGFLAFSSDDESPLDPGERLVTGEAYGKVSWAGTSGTSDWSTYRGNSSRSGSTKEEIPVDMKRVWEALPGGQLTQPVVSGEILVVASIDQYEIHAFDRRTGKTLWSNLTGGRVDSSPTLHEGKVYFGATDGTVTCLRASDGALVWNHLIAPSRRCIVVRERVESTWPVKGSVLVKDGLVYAAAGRSSYLDGGIILTALDPVSGKTVHRKSYATPHPDFTETMRNKEEKAREYPLTHVRNQYATDWKTFTDPDRSDSFAMEGSVSELLLESGGDIYMKHACFDASLERREISRRHLYATTHFLDGSEQHRTHYVLGTGNFTGAVIGYSWVAESHSARAGQFIDAPYGLLLSYEGKTAWGVYRSDQANGVSLSKPGNYTLFSEVIREQAPGMETRKDMQEYRRGMQMREWNWEASVNFRPRALLHAGGILVLGGARSADSEDPFGMYAEDAAGQIRFHSVKDGAELSKIELEASPVWDGLAAAGGYLYVSTTDGRVLCLGQRTPKRP